MKIRATNWKNVQKKTGTVSPLAKCRSPEKKALPLETAATNTSENKKKA